jgi:hypothetical protein
VLSIKNAIWSTAINYNPIILLTYIESRSTSKPSIYVPNWIFCAKLIWLGSNDVKNVKIVKSVCCTFSEVVRVFWGSDN